MRRVGLKKLLSVEMFVLYTVLVTGALVFSFPFIWMVAASFKTTSEVGGIDAPLWPSVPAPQPATPYIDTRTFDPPERFFGISESDWSRVHPELQSLIANRLEAWSPHSPGGDARHDEDTITHDTYIREMAEGLFRLINERLSDQARAQGPDAILAEARNLIGDGMLEAVFDRIYRRFCLGAIRMRSIDYTTHTTSVGDRWSLLEGDAELLSRHSQDKPYQLVAVQFNDNQPSVTFRIIPTGDYDPAEIDRLMISLRPDETWARVGFEVVRAGRRYRTTEVINCSDGRWREVHLRWLNGTEDPVQRRTYFVLHDVGPAPGDSEPFSVDLTLTRSSRIGAWYDKMMHQYRAVFREIPFSRYIMTSLLVSILSIVLMVFSCTLVAYAFARLSWPGRDLCFVVMLATMMIPPQVTMIPSFLIFKSIGWYDTLLPLWAPAAFGAPFFIFLLRQFLKTIPRDLEDAARIDGCGFLRVYWHVMFPLVTPTIAIIAVYTFIASWNNFMGPLIYVNDERLFPLALGLFKFNLRAGPDAGLVMAASFIMTLPVILLFFFVQRYFIQGVTLTGMKG